MKRIGSARNNLTTGFSDMIIVGDSRIGCGDFWILLLHTTAMDLPWSFWIRRIRWDPVCCWFLPTKTHHETSAIKLQHPSGFYSVLSIFGGSDISMYGWSCAFLRVFVRECFFSAVVTHTTYLLALTLCSRGKKVLVASTYKKPRAFEHTGRAARLSSCAKRKHFNELLLGGSKGAVIQYRPPAGSVGACYVLQLAVEM
mgnify:CR=1 FL=1